MEQITKQEAETALAQLSSESKETGLLLQKSLSSEAFSSLLELLNRTAKRYPNQDLTDAIPEYVADFEKLALKYSLHEVSGAIGELRIDPKQDFFPTPTDVVRKIEAKRLKRVPSHLYARG